VTLKINTFSSLKRNESLYSEDFLNEKNEAFHNTINDVKYGFLKTIESQTLVEETKEVFKKFESKKHFVHVGVGGSSLGPEMLISALQKKSDTKFTFINNIDPDYLHDQLECIDIKNSVFYFVSKSGGTAETMASFTIIFNMLSQKGISEAELKDYFIFATDPSSSQLLDMGKELSISTLQVPSNVGGRFSVLTPVGYLPALFAGIDIDELINGAKEASKNIIEAKADKSQLLEVASYLYDHYENGYDQTVFMPYSSKLKNFAAWFIQLWAESLGKANDVKGKLVNKGLTPIASYGATDQHSQMQLFMEGPFNKCLFLIEVEKFEKDFSLANSFKYPSLEKLAPYSLSQLMKAELNGTLKALKENKRPFIHIVLEKNDETNLGALVLFLESLTALMGHYLEVDPFDQPGVELGKKYAFEWLNNS
jgi:glucose-6-phosphate isomerase